MKKKKVIIYGIGRFAEYAGYVFNNDSNCKVAGYSIESSLLNSKDVFNSAIDYIPFENLEEVKPPEDYEIFIAVGNNLIRERLFSSAKRQGYRMASYISSKASTWPELEVGENSFISEGSLLQPFVTIGNNSILFSSQLGHHSKIGDHSLLSGTFLGGNVKVGDYSFLGLHSSIKENTKIGARNIIGMGTVITADTEDNAIYTAPAAKKRTTTFQDFYRDHL